MALVVTRARTEDLGALCELLRALFEQEAEFSPQSDRQERGLNSILEAPKLGQIWTARESGAVVGMVSLLFVVSTALGGRAALLEDFVVRPDRRRRGIGSALLERALDEARRAGCLRITLLTDADNQGAARLYRRFGFEPSTMAVLRRPLADT